MKKYVALLLILSTMALAGCKAANPPATNGAGVVALPSQQTTAPTVTTQPTTTTQPTEPTQPSEPTQPTEPTQPWPSTPVEELAEFNTLLGQMGSWYNMALVSQYSSPTQIKLLNLFYLGFEGESHEPTDAEWAQLKDQPGFDINYSLIRMPVDRMNQVLTELFGITLEDVEDAGFENLVYLESTNCYYYMCTDTWVTENFNAVAVETQEDGSIRVYYTANSEDTVYVVTLMPNGDGYRILSNLPLE